MPFGPIVVQIYLQDRVIFQYTIAAKFHKSSRWAPPQPNQSVAKRGSKIPILRCRRFVVECFERFRITDASQHGDTCNTAVHVTSLPNAPHSQPFEFLLSICEADGDGEPVVKAIKFQTDPPPVPLKGLMRAARRGGPVAVRPKRGAPAAPAAGIISALFSAHP